MPILTAALEKLFTAASRSQSNELNLSNQHLDADDVEFLMSQLVTRTEITSLNLSGNHLNDKTLEPFTRLDRLQTLTLTGNELTDVSVAALVKIPSLTSLNLNFNRISNMGALTLGSKGRLQFLSLNGNHITIDGLVTLAQNTYLRHLSLMNNEVVDRGIELLGNSLFQSNNLQTLLLGNNYLHDEGLKYLAAFTHLIELNLSYNRLSSAAIDNLACHFHGSKLDISHNYLGDRGATKLANMSQLIDLNVCHNQINHIGTAKLAQHKHLQKLNLSYNHLNDEAIKELAYNDHLTWLDISHNAISAIGLEGLADNTALQTLYLTDSQLDDDNIAPLLNNTCLTQLDLSSNKIGNKGAELLSRMPYITSLRLNYNMIGNEGAKALAKNIRLRSLCLDYNQISDEGAKALASNTTLSHLSLVFNALSDVGSLSLTKSLSPISSSLPSSYQANFQSEDINDVLLWSKVLVSIIDRDGFIQFCNTYLLNTLGYTSETMSNRNITDFIHPQDISAIRHLLSNGIGKDIILKFLDTNGDCKIINWSFQWRNKVIYLLGTDLSLQKKTEKIITKMIHKEMDQNTSIISKQTEFISHLCHELRNPLSGIVSLVDIIYENTKELHELKNSLANTALDDTKKHELFDVVDSKKIAIEKALADIRICCHYQEEILNDNLDVTKILEGKIELSEQIIHIGQELEKVIAISQSKATKKDLALQLVLSQSNDCLVKGDAMRIKQITLNLVNNAIKFTDKGGIVVALSILDVSDKKTHFSLTVGDTGIGLKKEEIDALFGRYTQANLSIGSHYGGSGLGLYISRQLSQKMGGNLSVTSEAGVGSQFTCDFFCHNLSLEEKMAFIPMANLPSPILAPSSLIQSRTCSALVVEDNAINVKVLIYMLEKMGHTCRIANDGLEAVQCYRDHHRNINVIFMDTYMPKMTGLEAIAHIRQFEQQQHLVRVPIITLSGNALESDKALALKAGADDYMTKPFKKAEIALAITKWTGANSRLESTSSTDSASSSPPH